MDNLIIDSILSRSSVRMYKPDVEIPDSVMTEILKCAMSAPTAVNRQPWHFVVVRDHDKLKQLAAGLPYAKMAAGASVAVVACGDTTRFLEGEDDHLWVQDLSAASENLLLAANALGYGGVWTCIYPHADRTSVVRDVLALPERYIPFNLIPLGVPDGHLHHIDKWNPANVTTIP